MIHFLGVSVIKITIPIITNICYGTISSWDVLAAAESRSKVQHGADERGDQGGVLCRGTPGHSVVQHQPAHE